MKNFLVCLHEVKCHVIDSSIFLTGTAIDKTVKSLSKE